MEYKALPIDRYTRNQHTAANTAMKSAIFAFFGLIASAYAATAGVSSELGAMAEGMGAVAAAVSADTSSGAASGATDGAGTVMGAASVGGAMAAAMSSPEPTPAF